MYAWKLWKQLFNKEHLEEIFENKISKSSSTGLDKINVQKFSEILEDEMDIIIRKTHNDTYQFTRYRQLLFSKGKGKNPRVISIPTVRDKLTTTALHELIINVFGDECKTALPQEVINRICNSFNQYDRYLKLDIETFYASIQHELLSKKIYKKIRKREIYSLIMKAVKTETVPFQPQDNEKKEERKEGIPEGLPISNALANIYMLDLDKKYKGKEDIRYFRYVDDILVFLTEDNYKKVEKELTRDINELGLKIKKEKLERGKVNTQFQYLGYILSNSKVTVRQSGIYRMEQSLEEVIKNALTKNKRYIEWKLNLKITGFILDDNKYGWMFFYSQITDTDILHHLDWLVKKLLVRYQLELDIHPKKFVRTYYEIRKALHTTKYIPNLNDYSIEDKRKLLTEIYGEILENKSDKAVEYLFRKIMKKEIRDIERDVEHIS